MYKVIIAPQAKRELSNAIAYLRHELGNPIAASRLADGAQDTFQNLRTMSERYPLCDDPALRIQGYRRAPVLRYLLIFRITKKPDQVRILHFFHETQDYRVTLLAET